MRKPFVKDDMRIILRDFDPVSEIMILQDVEGILSLLTLSLDMFNKWRIDLNSGSISRTQMYMELIKIQGGKHTILKQLDDRKSSDYYDNMEYTG